MITFCHEYVDELVAFRLEDRIMAEDIDQIADALQRQFSRSGHVCIYIEIAESVEESIGGIVEQAIKGLTIILPNLGKIKKAAMVTDKSWLKRIAEFEDYFLKIEVRGFTTAEKDSAFQWVRI